MQLSEISEKYSFFPGGKKKKKKKKKDVSAPPGALGLRH